MLNRLYIQNYALIDTLDINFGRGLNMMTGETGAGKSIVLGALSLILGQRAENRFLFDAGRKCVIEGEFDVSAYNLQDFFDANDLDYAEETLLRREFSADGKSRAFINDTPVNLQLLKSFSERLIDIHSQHATLQVASPDFQLLVLDSVAGQMPLRSQFAKFLQRYKSAKQTLEERRQEAAQRASEADYKQYLFDELESAQLQRGEVAILEEELNQLTHAEEIKTQLQSTVYVLKEGEVNVEVLLKDAWNQLSKAMKHMSALEGQSERLRSSMIELKDLANELEAQGEALHLDEERLQFVQSRLSTLYALQQKHKLSDADELVDRYEQLAAELSISAADETEIAELQQRCNDLLQELATIADQLRKGRVQAIPVVEKQVLGYLKNMGMPGSRLSIVLDSLEGHQYRNDGGDKVSFMFSSNVGQSLQPVGKVASGGELSRLMLAIKVLVAQYTALPTIIFDEIDTGISGEVALRVGDILDQLGNNMQVIVISHLPQIASRGEVHFKIFKEVDGGKTNTKMGRLDESGRVMEIAQMLSGAEPGEAAIAHAKSLLRLS